MNTATDAAGIQWDHTTPEPGIDPSHDQLDQMRNECVRMVLGMAAPEPTIEHIHALIHEIKALQSLLAKSDTIAFGDDPF